MQAATYPIQVGSGGQFGTQGGPSVFNSETAVGGGKGGKGTPGAGGPGGSGGGQGGGTGQEGSGQNCLDQLNKVIQVEMEIPVVVMLVVAVVPVLLEEILQPHLEEVVLVV